MEDNLLFKEGDYHWIKFGDDQVWEIGRVKKWSDDTYVFLLTSGSIIRHEDITAIALPEIEKPA